MRRTLTILFLTVTHAAWAQVQSRDSVATGGAQAVGGVSFFSSIGSDGRFVSFQSDATNLVAGDTNAATDIFVHDRTTGATTRVSVDSSGAQAVGGPSFSSSISSDGRFVAFESGATNLVAGDTNADDDIFVHDRTTGATTRVNVDSGGAQAVGGVSVFPSISSDGRFVGFSSDATNLVAADTNALRDTFVHDRTTGATTRVSVDSGGAQAVGGGSAEPSLSADGRFVAFESSATNLVAGDTNAFFDVFVHDRTTGATTRVSVDSGGAQAVGGISLRPRINSDGRFVAFDSEATNLVAGDTNALGDIFVHDRTSGATTRVSVDSGGAQAVGGISVEHSISSDGRFVAFRSDATNLVAGDTNALTDIFVHDRNTGATTRVSVDSGGAQAVGGVSFFPSISSDGRSVVFSSDATNLVAGDTNGFRDIFTALNPLAPPVAGTVSDGPGSDIDQQASTTELTANWAEFLAGGSPIVGYEWAIGTTPGGIDVRPFVDVGTATAATQSGLSLVGGTTYYNTVRAIDANGNKSLAAISDGVTVSTSGGGGGGPCAAGLPMGRQSGPAIALFALLLTLACSIRTQLGRDPSRRDA